jgi:predicted 3-demethylubiquinone-9 3-methyltransferase (glyoxalase superfamily)
VLTATFEIRGQEFQILNGGPYFKFNEAISLYVDCEDQQEVDYFWEKLTADGGEESECGWLKDKYGVSWQIVPRELMTLLADPDREKAGRVMQSMLKMQKIDVAELRRAYNQA